MRRCTRCSSSSPVPPGGQHHGDPAAVAATINNGVSSYWSTVTNGGRLRRHRVVEGRHDEQRAVLQRRRLHLRRVLERDRCEGRLVRGLGQAPVVYFPQFAACGGIAASARSGSGPGRAASSGPTATTTSASSVTSSATTSASALAGARLHRGRRTRDGRGAEQLLAPATTGTHRHHGAELELRRLPQRLAPAHPSACSTRSRRPPRPTTAPSPQADRVRQRACAS